MKRILILATLLAMSQTLVFAQKEHSIKEADVPIRFVKDFQSQNKNAQNVTWTMTPDSVYYMATFVNSDGDLQAQRFSNHGTETRYFTIPTPLKTPFQTVSPNTKSPVSTSATSKAR